MQAMGGLSGRRLADYELSSPLGDDGFGPIYAARHLHLGRVFAVRVLSDQFTFAQGFEERFQRVAQVLSVLEHPNLLTLDDYGIDGPYAYLVTPLVEGVTLEAWLRQRTGQPAHPAQVLRLFGQMLAGLGYAHQANVTHLSLTPRHILIQPNGHLLLANFGLPYLAEQLWIAWNGSRTFGDPLYLAPEQMPGRTPDGVAADLYALGVILYRLLTGALPFEGSLQALLEAKRAGPPPLRAKHPDLPAALEALVQRALAPSPADRWASAAALGEAFYQALGQPPPPPPSLLPSGGSVRSAPLLLAPEQPAPPPAGYAPLPAPPVESSSRKSDGPGMLAWSSAGRGRISLPPPPPGWRREAAAAPSPPLRARSQARRLLSAALKALVLLITLAVLGGAIFFGYQRWVQIQQQIPTPTPIPPSPAAHISQVVQCSSCP